MPACERLLAGFLDPRTLADARRRAQISKVSLPDILLTGPASEVADHVRRLADHLGVRFGPPAPMPHDSVSASDVAAALRRGLFRHPVTHELSVVPRADALERLLGLLQADPSLRRRVRLAAPGMLTEPLLDANADAVARMMATGPAGIDHRLSAARMGALRLAGIGLFAALAGSAIAAVAGVNGAHIPFALAFLGLTVLRLWILLSVRLPEPRPPLLPDGALPIYTVLVPLHREGPAICSLLRALAALDYPPELLDIKLLVETDDAETRCALAHVDLPAHMECVVLPPGEPRTKPRALNFGLAAARGSLLVIYDAEDRPQPDQLRLAATQFAAWGEETACAQARLSIDNTHDNWLTRAFTLEYAGLFEIFLPVLARKGRLLPLGGTSNHFRVDVLRRIGGWDAFNVTEDADLGVRLIRFGYRIATIASVTFEEAPNTLGFWIRQRTRWLKGYMVTWCVHMRQPATLLRELGPVNFCIFQAVICGVPMAALAQTVCLFVLGWQVVNGTLLAGDNMMAMAVAILLTLNLALGYGAAAAIAWLGSQHQRLPRMNRWLWLLVPYWLLVALAGYRALFQLAFEPFRWEKTDHGMARTSRMGDLRDGLGAALPPPPVAARH